MKTLRPPLLILSLLLSFVLPAASASAEARRAALGAAGEVYQLRAGTYGQFFSAGLIPAANPVLVLEVLRPGRRHPVRMLVPGTESEDVELEPSLMLEESSGAVVVVWSGQWNYIHSRINLILWNGESWSRPIELSGDVWSRKSSPAVAVTRSTYVTSGLEGPVFKPRTTYHVVWWEAASGGNRVAYSPVVFVEGAYIGWNPVFILTDLISADPDPLAAVSPSLSEVPTIQAGTTSASVVAAFVDSESGRLVTMELSDVAGEMAYVAQQVTADLVDFAQQHGGATPLALGERARAQMVDFGRRVGMHPGLLDFVSRQTQGHIQQTSTAASVGSISDRARAQMVDFGARMSAQGLSGEIDEPTAWVLEVANSSNEAEPSREPHHSIRLRQVASFSAPSLGSTAISTFVSGSGRSLIIAWQDEQQMIYVETTASGWSDRRSVELGEHLSAQQALELLEARVRNH